MKTIKRHIIASIISFLLLCTAVAGGHAARHVSRSPYHDKLDTLTLGERIGMRTNVTDWIAVTPNMGLELTLGRMNWSRWTVGLSGRWGPKTHNTQTSYNAFDISAARLEVRRYQHGEGARRSWFLGGFSTYGYHRLKLSSTGFKGHHTALGITLGTITPLYSYGNGSSLDLELSASAGVVLAKHDEFKKDGNQYVTTQVSDKWRLTWEPLPWIAATDALRVSVVYHFGPSVANRYKSRLAIDERYRLHLNEVKLRNDSIRQARNEQLAVRRDSLEKADYERRFEKQRLELEKKYIADSLKRVREHEQE